MIHLRFKSYLASLLIAGGLIVSHSAFAALDVWVTGPSHKVLRTETSPEQSAIFNLKTGAISLFAARNEFVSFQIVFSGEGKSVNVEPFTLEGPQSAKLANVELFREHFMPCPIMSRFDAAHMAWDAETLDKKCRQLNAPREFPEQLVPLNATKFGAPFNVDKDKNEVVWVDIFVPEDAPPGEYKGTVVTAERKLAIKLNVWNFTLPSVSHFPNYVYIGPEQIAWAFRKTLAQLPEMPGVFDAYFQMAHNHRVSLMEEWEDESYIKRPDRNYYDYYTGKAFKGPFAKGYGFEVTNAEPKMVDMLKREGWLNRSFAWICDEPHTRDDYEGIIAKGRASKETTSGQLMRMVTTPFDPPESDWPRLNDGVDIFCSSANLPSRIPELEKSGKVAWTYNCGYGGDPFTDCEGPAMRMHAWAGYVSGSRMWLYWDGSYVVDTQKRWHKVSKKEIGRDPAKYMTDLWNDSLTFDEGRKPGYKIQDATRINGDAILFYPGQDVGIDGPLPCFRLKNLRQGTQDFEYLYLLEKMGKRGEAVAEANKLLGAPGITLNSIHRYPYDFDGAKWEAARIRLGTMLDRIGDKALRERIQPYNQYPNPVGHPDFYKGKRY